MPRAAGAIWELESLTNLKMAQDLSLLYLCYRIITRPKVTRKSASNSQPEIPSRIT